MRRATLERAKKAIKFMEQGVSMTDATKLANIDTRTFKKALKKLKVRTKKKDRKYYIITEYYKQIIDKFIYLMMGGWSATRASRVLHTTLRTMKKMHVVVKGKRRSLITKPEARYILNVYRVTKYPIVFYGRLLTRFGNTVTGSWDDGKNNINQDETDEDYANILWQIDFEPFTSTVTEEDVCKHYPILIMELLRDFFLVKISVNNKEINKKVRKMCINRPAYMSEKMLQIDIDQVNAIASGGKASKSVAISRLEIVFGQAGIEFDRDVECGIEDRGVRSEYVSPSDFKKNWRKTVDDGAFEVIVRRKGTSSHYPPSPMIIPFKHDLMIEGKLPRKVKMGSLPILSEVD